MGMGAGLTPLLRKLAPNSSIEGWGRESVFRFRRLVVYFVGVRLVVGCLGLDRDYEGRAAGFIACFLAR
jgi:hypothetical protein